MVKKVILATILLLALSVSSVLAVSNVQIFFVACGDKAVINLSGTIDPGYDVFYQVFAGGAGSGAALTAMRRAQVDGTVAFSDQVDYNGDATVDTGATASVRVIVAREDNIDSSTMDTTVNDVQDGCQNPQNPLGTSTDVDAPATSTTVELGPPIVSPFGGFINSDLTVTAQPIVVIGARTHESYRSPNPGLIFAECDGFLPRATPGVVYDNDNIVIFWSWYARTEAQVQDHIDHAQYAVTLNHQPFENVVRTPIARRGSNFFVFYTAQIGNLAPGSYGVEYNVTWDQAINDGFDDYGPGTSFESLRNTCTFQVTRNVSGDSPHYNLLYSY